MTERFFYLSSLTIIALSFLARGFGFGFSNEVIFNSVDTQYYSHWLHVYLPFTQNYGLFLFVGVLLSSICVSLAYDKAVSSVHPNLHLAEAEIKRKALLGSLTHEQRTSIYNEHGVTGALRVYNILARLIILISLMVMLVAPFAGYWPFAFNALALQLPCLLLLWLVKYWLTPQLLRISLYNNDLIALLTISILGIVVIPPMISLYLFISMIIHSLVQRILNTHIMGKHHYVTTKNN